jgi:murein DD-endopeptidase MepM/ murein hydrolase activator NlpD
LLKKEKKFILQAFHTLFIFIFLLQAELTFCNKNGSNTYQKKINSIFAKHSEYISDGFDFPVGKPNAKKYYIAQKFRKKNPNFGNHFHLGEDWNGIGGGNSDLGDPVFSIANGFIIFAKDGGPGWGNVVIIIHKLPNKSKYTFIVSLYAHLQKMYVKKGNLVKRGQKIGTIGNVNGTYLAHLHLEMRSNINMPIGGGYAAWTKGFINPSSFIKKNRPKK